MTLSVACEGFKIALLQANFATAVGVAFAFPILSQIIETKNIKILQEAKRLLNRHDIKNHRGAFIDIGLKMNGFRFFNEKLAKISDYLNVFNAIIGIFSFLLINMTIFLSEYCLSYIQVYTLVIISCLPFICGLIYVLYWLDGCGELRGRMYYYNNQY